MPDTQKRRPPLRNRPPGKQSITREKYDELVESFRKHGDNFTVVADEVNVAWTTAKRAWTRGWHDQKSKPWARPIEEVLKKEQVAARAALEREKHALVNDARIARQDALRKAVEDGFNDLVESRAKQGKVIRAARDNSIAALIVSQRLLKAAIPLSAQIENDLQDSSLTVFERLRLLRQVGRFAHDAIEMAQVAEEMERKALGEPDVLLQVQHGVTMSVDEAKETLAEVAEVLKMYEAGDVEDVIDVEWSDSDELSVPSDKSDGDQTDDDQPTDVARERGDA